MGRELSNDHLSIESKKIQNSRAKAEGGKAVLKQNKKEKCRQRPDVEGGEKSTGPTPVVERGDL